ncbi:hypothetical protein SLOPH_1173 [Spraguea lophii 42_110]|uniref:Uncharacterized protein n=1 Tax=Spraguea lophii (strain 42_110) TaxID=1358809 RepID=S7W6J9_SPRLO|nr:hypothetical protein SLOPH_1173 [Spraguea lophii 42_110]
MNIFSIFFIYTLCYKVNDKENNSADGNSEVAISEDIEAPNYIESGNNSNSNESLPEDTSYCTSSEVSEDEESSIHESDIDFMFLECKKLAKNNDMKCLQEDLENIYGDYKIEFKEVSRKKYKRIIIEDVRKKLCNVEFFLLFSAQIENIYSLWEEIKHVDGFLIMAKNLKYALKKIMCEIKTFHTKSYLHNANEYRDLGKSLRRSYNDIIKYTEIISKVRSCVYFISSSNTSQLNNGNMLMWRRYNVENDLSLKLFRLLNDLKLLIQDTQDMLGLDFDMINENEVDIKIFDFESLKEFEDFLNTAKSLIVDFIANPICCGEDKIYSIYSFDEMFLKYYNELKKTIDRENDMHIFNAFLQNITSFSTRIKNFYDCCSKKQEMNIKGILSYNSTYSAFINLMYEDCQMISNFPELLAYSEEITSSTKVMLLKTIIGRHLDIPRNQKYLCEIKRLGKIIKSYYSCD